MGGQDHGKAHVDEVCLLSPCLVLRFASAAWRGSPGVITGAIRAKVKITVSQTVAFAMLMTSPIQTHHRDHCQNRSQNDTNIHRHLEEAGKWETSAGLLQRQERALFKRLGGNPSIDAALSRGGRRRCHVCLYIIFIYLSI